MAGIGYLIGGVFLGAAWGLIGLTVALSARRPRVARAAVIVTAAVPVLALVANRPRYMPLGIVAGVILAVVMLGLGRAFAEHDPDVSVPDVPGVPRPVTAERRDDLAPLPPPRARGEITRRR